MHTAVTSLPTPPRTIALRRRPPASHQTLRLARGRTLFFADDAAESFFEITSGVVRCCRITENGRRQVFRFARAGDILGLSTEESYGYDAEAVIPVVVISRRLGSLDAAMARDELLCRRVVRALRAELAATRTHMILLGRMTATERLASFVASLAPSGLRRGACLEIPMSRIDIGDYLGLAMETVSRKFSELADQGLIRLETPQRIRILDPERLEAMARTT